MNSVLRKEASLDEAVTFIIRTLNNAQAKFGMIKTCLRSRFELEEDFLAQESSIRDLIFNSFDNSFNQIHSVQNHQNRNYIQIQE